MKKLSVLILSKDLQGDGGVVNFISTLLHHVSPHVKAKSFQLGGYQEQGIISAGIQFFKDILRLSKTVNELDIDCIHINPSFNVRSLIRDLILIRILAIVAPGVGILAIIHGWDETVAQKGKRSAILSFLVASSFNRCSTVLVLASSFKKDLISMGVNPNKIHVISTMFHADLLRNQYEEEPKPIQSLLFLSRFVKEKGIYEVLEAFEKLNKSFPNLKLTMAGEGPEKKRIEDWIKLHHLSFKIDLCGYVRGDRKAEILNNADLFVFPTYYGEGCPVSLLEALAAGLPVVTTTVGGISDIIRDGKNGILLEQVSTESVEKAISTFLHMTPEQIKSIGDHNRKEAWQKYEANVVTRNLEHVYYKVAYETA